jgi:hypothetical protein
MKDKRYWTTFTFLIEAPSHSKLKEASKKMRVPMSELIREGIDMRLRKIYSQDGKIQLWEGFKDDRTGEKDSGNRGKISTTKAGEESAGETSEPETCSTSEKTITPERPGEAASAALE